MSELKIKAEEFENRVERVQAAMRQEGLDALVCYADAWRISNVAYFADYRAFDGILPISYAVVTVGLNGPPQLYLFPTCLPLAEFTWLKQAHALDRLLPALQRDATQADWRKIGIAGYSLMPAQLYQLIASGLPGVAIQPTELLNKIKAKKSASEVEMMIAAAKITDLAMDAIRSALAAGSRKEYELAAIANYAMMSAGAEGPAFDTLIQSGPNSWRNLRRPTDRVIQRGDVILIDVGARYNGYACDIGRGVCFGETDPRAREMLLLAVKAFEAGVAVVKPGIRSREIDEAVRAVFRDAGYEQYFTEAAGHGVGHDPEEEIPFCVPGADDLIERDMTLVVKSALMIPGVGGVRIEDEVVVDQAGARLITSYPRELFWD
jgi:Xaa-Pro aminopeptidase